MNTNTTNDNNNNLTISWSAILSPAKAFTLYIALLYCEFAVFLYEILAAYENVIMKMVIAMDRHFLKHFLTFGCFMIFRWPWRAESIPFIKLCNFVTFRNLGHVERNAMRVWKHAVASSIFQPLPARFVSVWTSMCPSHENLRVRFFFFF